MKINELNLKDFTYDEKTDMYIKKEGKYLRKYKKIKWNKCNEDAFIRTNSKSIYCSKSCSQKDKPREN